MSIFNTSNLIAGAANNPTGNTSSNAEAMTSPALSGQSSLALSTQTLTFQAPLTYATFYTGGATFSGVYGKFVKS